MVRLVLLAAALCALTPSRVQAQLYSWTDADGRLIISDQPRDPGARTYLVFGREATPKAAAVATTGSNAATVATSSNAGVAGARSNAMAYYGTTKPVSLQAAGYDDLITEHATAHDLNPDFVRAVIQAESAFNPFAKSPKGAMGLMQLMPATAAVYRVLDAYNPAENIRAGVAYLKSLMTRYDNDVSLALAAYNAGPNAVEKYGRKVPPYKETRSYVARIKKQAEADEGPKNSPTVIYKIVKVVDGHEIVSYSNRPSPGAVPVR